MVFFEEIYALTMLGNYAYNWAYDKQKDIKLSGLEKMSIGASVLMGVDALVAPALLGDSLHNTLGLDLSYNHEQAVMSIEFLAASSGAFYFTGRNMKVI